MGMVIDKTIRGLKKPDLGYLILYLFNTMVKIPTSTLTAYISDSPVDHTALGVSSLLCR
jgi:hypothetical protein